MSTAGEITSARKWVRIGWLIGLGIVAVLLAANAHLVYVAFTSQPDCVSHLKLPDGSNEHFRAAKSGC